MSNYEITKRRMQKEFLKYDQEEMIRKFSFSSNSDYLYIDFLGHRYRVDRANGMVMWSDDNFVNMAEAGYNEAMTLYDVLCNSKADCCLAGEFVNMKSLSSIKGSSAPLGTNHFQKEEKLFDHNEEVLAKACENLNGKKLDKGDVAYQIQMFDFMPIIIQFWNSDKEFEASLQVFTDKNILQYMHYETVWYAVSHLLTRLKEEIGVMIEVR